MYLYRSLEDNNIHINVVMIKLEDSEKNSILVITGVNYSHYQINFFQEINWRINLYMKSLNNSEYSLTSKFVTIVIFYWDPMMSFAHYRHIIYSTSNTWYNSRKHSVTSVYTWEIENERSPGTFSKWTEYFLSGTAEVQIQVYLISNLWVLLFL